MALKCQSLKTPRRKIFVYLETFGFIHLGKKKLGIKEQGVRLEVTWLYYSMLSVRGPQLDKGYNMNT